MPFWIQYGDDTQDPHGSLSYIIMHHYAKFQRPMCKDAPVYSEQTHTPFWPPFWIQYGDDTQDPHGSLTCLVKVHETCREQISDCSKLKNSRAIAKTASYHLPSSSIKEKLTTSSSFKTPSSGPMFPNASPSHITKNKRQSEVSFSPTTIQVNVVAISLWQPMPRGAIIMADYATNLSSVKISSKCDLSRLLRTYLYTSPLARVDENKISILDFIIQRRVGWKVQIYWSTCEVCQFLATVREKDDAIQLNAQKHSGSSPSNCRLCSRKVQSEFLSDQLSNISCKRKKSKIKEKTMNINQSRSAIRFEQVGYHFPPVISLLRHSFALQLYFAMQLWKLAKLPQAILHFPTPSTHCIRHNKYCHLLEEFASRRRKNKPCVQKLAYGRIKLFYFTFASTY
ncbi:hypothetical protein GQR58_027038 [Nymphon striatum]|nr:hypothetical protein GQR58_027038 [Nymphon striatum]